MATEGRTKLEGIKARLGAYMFAQDTVAGIPPEVTAATVTIGGRTYLLADDLDFALQLIDRYEAYFAVPTPERAEAIRQMRAVQDEHVRRRWWPFWPFWR